MPTLQDFSLCQLEDATVQVNLAPPTNINNFDLRFTMLPRFGGVSGLIQLTCGSGYNGVSGINITNPSQGQFQMSFKSIYTSGLDSKNYAYLVDRTTSGSRTVLTEGYVSLLPGPTQ